MFKNPRLYLKILTGWLLLTNFGHTFLGMREFSTQASDPSSGLFPVFSSMNADLRAGYFDYTLFDIFMMGMLALTLLLLFAALVSLWVALKGSQETLSQFSKLNLAFWGAALIANLLFHPLDNMIIILIGAVLFSGLAFWRARKET